MSAYNKESRPGLDPLIAQLVRARVDQDLSQEAMALKAGVSRATLARWERGTHGPTLPGLTRWTRALGLTLKVIEDTP